MNRAPLNLGYSHPYMKISNPELARPSPPFDVNVVLSDTDYQDCFGAPIWSGGPYRTYRIQSPVEAIMTSQDTPTDGRDLGAPVLSLFRSGEIAITVAAAARMEILISGTVAALHGGAATTTLRLRSEADQHQIDA